MGQTTVLRSVRSLVDSKRILDVLLKNLIQKKNITPEDANVLLGATIRKIADAIFAQAITIFIADHMHQQIRFQNVYYSPSLYGTDDERKKWYEKKSEELESVVLPIDQGIVGQVIKSGETAFVADAQRDPHFNRQVDRNTGFTTLSMIAAPLKVGDAVIGCIQVLNKCRDGQIVTQFTREDVLILEDVARYSAKAIQRAKDPKATFTEREIAGFIARQTKLELIELDAQFELDMPLLQSFGEEILKRYQILPLKKLSDDTMRAALSNPLDFHRIEDFLVETGVQIVEKVVAASGDIKNTLLRAFPEASQVTEMAAAVKEEYASRASDHMDMEVFEDDENSAPIVRLGNKIIEDAYLKGASDIHIEPFENKVRVRYRIDGLLKEQMEIPPQAHRALISRIKIMSNLNISERRLPQDGRIVFKKFNSKFDLDLRVSVVPMNYGEKVCARILDKTRSTLPLEKLGFSEYNMKLYRDLIQIPYGMILHCGPTGSGKSMTLYAALNEINSPEWNISTVEDPIEYTLFGLNQMQMKKDIGLTFAAALRSFLRQDPDIILVGEIRDLETAEIAIEAALTGHVLFSTLHTNDAPSTITRFDEMGIEPFMVSTCLMGICAQRLLRRLCSCKQPDNPKTEERALLERALDNNPIDKIMRPGGCEKCSKSGYQGRVGTHELLTVTDELRALINRKATIDQLKQAAREGGMRTLFEDLMEKVKQGLTSLPEAVATARPDDTPHPARAKGASTTTPKLAINPSIAPESAAANTTPLPISSKALPASDVSEKNNSNISLAAMLGLNHEKPITEPKEKYN